MRFYVPFVAAMLAAPAFGQTSAMPDAERLLRLLEWYAWRLAEDRQRLLFRNGAPTPTPPDRQVAKVAKHPTNVRITNIR